MHIGTAYQRAAQRFSTEWSFFQMNHVFNIIKFFLPEGESLKITDGLWRFWQESLLWPALTEAIGADVQRHRSRLAPRGAGALAPAFARGMLSRSATASPRSVAARLLLPPRLKQAWRKYSCMCVLLSCPWIQWKEFLENQFFYSPV